MWLVVSLQNAQMVLASEGSEKEKLWLGAYVGSSIPGYLVRSSFIVEFSGSGRIQKGATPDVIRDLIASCQSGGGRALINYRSSIGIGRVPLSSGDGKVSIIDPGIFMQGMGDCVDKVEALK